MSQHEIGTEMLRTAEGATVALRSVASAFVADVPGKGGCARGLLLGLAAMGLLAVPIGGFGPRYLQGLMIVGPIVLTIPSLLGWFAVGKGKPMYSTQIHVAGSIVEVCRSPSREYAQHMADQIMASVGALSR